MQCLHQVVSNSPDLLELTPVDCFWTSWCTHKVALAHKHITVCEPQMHCFTLHALLYTTCLSRKLNISLAKLSCTQRGVPDVLVVSLAGLIAFRSVHGVLKPWLIEVGLIHKDEGLD